MLFTGAMLQAHVILVLSNMTTVEQMGAQRMRHREQRVLARLHKWYEFRARRETVAQWDGEWGRIGKEGHMWWLGSARKNWEAVMGDSVWMWFREYLFFLLGFQWPRGWGIRERERETDGVFLHVALQCRSDRARTTA